MFFNVFLTFGLFIYISVDICGHSWPRCNMTRAWRKAERKEALRQLEADLPASVVGVGMCELGDIISSFKRCSYKLPSLWCKAENAKTNCHHLFRQPWRQSAALSGNSAFFCAEPNNDKGRAVADGVTQVPRWKLHDNVGCLRRTLLGKAVRLLEDDARIRHDTTTPLQNNLYS